MKFEEAINFKRSSFNSLFCEAHPISHRRNDEKKKKKKKRKKSFTICYERK